VKYVVCVPDGAADEPLEELGGRTPLEAARLPTFAALARRAEVGRAATIPAGFPPGSDVGNMSILGYDPARYHTGRAPIEAAAMGLQLADDQVAYRCNLVTVGADGTMVDFAGGHPTTEAAHEVVDALEKELGGDGIEFHPGVQYRHILVTPADWAEADCTPPHDLTGKPAVWPTGPASARLRDLMDASRQVVGRFTGAGTVAATQIWLWGQGRQPRLPSFADTYGLQAGMVSAVDLVRGLGALTGIRVAQVDGITGWYDTNYEAKRDACLESLAAGDDLFLIHVEASDEAGHAGNVEEKVTALENWDRRILAPLVNALDMDDFRPWRLLLLPDHATPLALRTHTSDPVPYMLVDSEVDGAGGVYTEAGTADRTPVPGHTLMHHLITASPAAPDRRRGP